MTSLRIVPSDQGVAMAAEGRIALPLVRREGPPVAHVRLWINRRDERQGRESHGYQVTPRVAQANVTSVRGRANCPAVTTLAPSDRLPKQAFAPQEIPMPAPQRTEQLLDAIDDHIEATVAVRDEVIRAAADQEITRDELRRILTAVTRMDETGQEPKYHALHLHASNEIVQIVNQAGLTPKAERRVREMRADIVRLDEVRAARRAAYVEGPSAA